MSDDATLTPFDEWMLTTDFDSWSEDDIRFALIWFGEMLREHRGES